MATAKLASGRMSAREFRALQAARPYHERWELIGGVATMMTPPTIAHNRIAGNLERLLNAALSAHDPTSLANQRPGMELGRIGDDFRPEPDIAVIDAGSPEQAVAEIRQPLAVFKSGRRTAKRESAELVRPV